MSYMKDIALDQSETIQPLCRTPKHERREAAGNRISEIMRLVRSGKTMAEALEIVDRPKQ